jgi:O-antigen ligase
VFNRPSAPFPYTNAWGTNFTLLLFFGFAMIVAFRSRLAKIAVTGLLVAASYPALETGNRGMLLGIAVFLVYGIARLTWRGRTGPLLTLLAVGLVAVAAGLPGYVFDTFAARQAFSSSNDTRSTVYAEAFQGALDSPILGQGTPKASASLEVAVGTQGHVWNVMFSYGFIALALFLGWFLLAAWGSRHARGSSRLWLHVAACVPLVTLFYYGYDGPQLAVAMVACAAALRPPAADTPAPRTARRPRRELQPL